MGKITRKILNSEELANASPEERRACYEELAKDYEAYLAEVGYKTPEQRRQQSLNFAGRLATSLGANITLIPAAESTDGQLLFRPLTREQKARVVEGSMLYAFGNSDSQQAQE